MRSFETSARFYREYTRRTRSSQTLSAELPLPLPMPPTSDDPDEGATRGALDGAFESKTETNADTSTANRGALMEGDEVKFNARIPENLRDAFQEVCESEGRSMSWAVREYMRRVVEQGETGL